MYSLLNSKTCLNRTLNKPESCINRTLHDVPMQEIFLNLTCIYPTPVLLQTQKVQFRQDSLYSLPKVERWSSQYKCSIFTSDLTMGYRFEKSLGQGVFDFLTYVIKVTRYLSCILGLLQLTCLPPPPSIALNS